MGVLGSSYHAESGLVHLFRVSREDFGKLRDRCAEFGRILGGAVDGYVQDLAWRTEQTS